MTIGNRFLYSTFLAVALMHASYSIAQNAPLKFQRFGVDQGLTVTTAFSIVQDDNGFLWISTIDGLHRYDGYTFVTYKNNFDDPQSLSDNTLSTIFKDSKGNFWIGTYNEGVNCFDPRTGRCKRYNAHADNPDHLSNGRVWCCCEDKDGKMWIGTDKGLDLLDPQTGKVTRFAHSEFDDSSISSDRILCITNKNGNIFVGTDHGLNEIVKKGRTFSFLHFFHSEDPASISNNIILSIYDPGNADELWVGTIDGLNRAVLTDGNAKWNFKKYRFTSETVAGKNEKDPVVYSYLNSYGDNSVRSTWLRNEHELWVATDKGLKILDPSTGKFSAYHSDPSDPRSLSAELCLCFCPDRSGNLWIGTMVGGINKTDLKPAKFPLIQTDFGNPFQLSSNNIRSVFVDSRGRWWVGTLGGGLNCMDPGKGKFERIIHKSKDPRQDFDPENVWTISEDKEHYIWIGTSNGLYRLDAAGAEFTAYTYDTKNENSLSNNIVRSILPDSKGNLWIGTEGGLDLFIRGSEKFQRFLHSAGDILSISNNTVWTVKEFKNELWVGTDDGLNRMNVEQNGKISFTRFNSTANKNSLSNRSVRAVYCDKTGTIWVGTNNGLNRYDEKTNSFQRFSEEDGLSNAFIYSILGDENDDLWISTNFGISHYIQSEKKFRNYDKLDGLQNNEFNTGAYFMANNGELFFGGPDGLNHFFPAKVKDNTVIPPVVITGIKVFGEEMKRNTEASEVNDITLRYDQNVLSFEFASLDLTQPEKNQYAYQLKGFDKKLIKAGNRRFVSYTNLDPGEYTFTVFASNNDGVWNEKGKSIHITIVPPFWKTWWFYAACIAFVVFTTWFTIRARINRLRKTQVYLEKQVSLKTKELREEKDTVESQKKLIEKKNQNITSSIQYAKRIQESILPLRENFNELLPEAFIFFRPKDIVSGDFYWFSKSGEKIIVAAVDCTGHGVPGAFMSLVGNNLLNTIVNVRHITDPKRILEELHKGVVKALKKDQQESGTVDGMDITLCSIDTAKMKLEFSSTGRSLIFVRGDESKKIKVGTQPVGFVGKKNAEFIKQEIPLVAGDTFYIFTDGYCDQFGEKEDEKFMEQNFEKLLLDNRHLPMPAQVELLEKTLDGWKGALPQLDDILVIGMRIA